MGLGCCSFIGGGSVVVDSLLFVALFAGFCNCSMFCYALLCNHIDGEEGYGFFAVFVFLMSRNCYVALPRGVTDLSEVCNCGIS